MPTENNGGGNQKSPAIKHRTAERERQVLELRLKGAQFLDIGRQLGISGVAAFKHYHRALRKIPEKEAASARKEQQERLDRLRVREWDHLASADPRYREDIVRTILKIEERESRLFGLDAPTKVEQTNLEDPVMAARRERQLEILGKLTVEERQELLQSMNEPASQDDISNTSELEK